MPRANSRNVAVGSSVVVNELAAGLDESSDIRIECSRTVSGDLVSADRW
jgi:hypothetical protein